MHPVGAGGVEDATRRRISKDIVLWKENTKGMLRVFIEDRRKYKAVGVSDSSPPAKCITPPV